MYKNLEKCVRNYTESTDKYIDFSAVNAYDKYVTWKLHNSGVYQAENAMLAIKAMEYLFRREMICLYGRRRLQVSCGKAEWKEVLPNVIVDGAHNIGAVEAFVKSVDQMKNTKTLFFFVSFG